MTRTTGRDPVSRRPMMDGITAITSDRTGAVTYQSRWQWVGPAGKRIFGAKIFRSLDDAETHLLEIMLAIRRGAYGPDDATVLADYAERWLVRMASSWSTGTQRARDISWRVHIAPKLGSLRVAEVTRARCQALVDGMVERGLQPSTISGHVATLHSLLAAAVRDGLIERNSASRLIMPRERSRSQAVWTLDQAQAFLATTVSTRHHVLWSLLLATGLRIGEALALTWADVDLDAHLVSVRATVRRNADGTIGVGRGTKTGIDRTVPIHGTTAQLLIRHRAAQRQRPIVDIAGYVFPGRRLGPLSGSAVRDALDRATEAAGLPRLTPHGFRHTAATLMIDQGIAPSVVQDILGHKHVTMTLERYTHVDLTMMRTAAARYGSSLNPVVDDNMGRKTGL